MKRKILSVFVAMVFLSLPILGSAENGPVVPMTEDGRPTGFYAKHYESKV